MTDLKPHLDASQRSRRRPWPFSRTSTNALIPRQTVQLLTVKTRAVFWSVTISVVMTWFVLLWLVYSDYHAVQANAAAQERHVKISELRGAILRLDEVLTMSAHMAASTGDLSWEKRYRSFEPELDAAIKEAMRLAPTTPADEAAAETDAANLKLVAMENQAFDLVREQRLNAARAVLFSKEYEDQKRIYARGMGTLADQLQSLVTVNLESHRHQAVKRAGTALLFILLWSSGWVIVLRLMNRGQQTLLQTTIQETHTAEQLAGLNAELDQKVTRLAFYDTLTGLPNRNQLANRLLAAMQTASRDGTPLGLILLDLDHFKEVNSALGHHRGDLLIQEVGARLKRAMFEPDLVARLGGDEFAVLLPKLRKSDDILVVLRKVQQALQDPFFIDQLPIHVEASIGAALYPEHGRTSEVLLQQADVAMYEAKRSHCGYRLYSPTLNPYNPQRLALLGELRTAIDQRQLVLHYQPKIRLLNRKTSGAEALVRWNHPERGMVPPDHFIGPAEQTGLIHPLTHWVLQTALHQCGVWQQSGVNLSVSVNLSAQSLLDPKLPHTVSKLLQTSTVPPHRIWCEITESTLMTDPTRAQDVLAQLHELGVRLSIDDFGIGYSSLSYLQKLPVDQIKIDKSFVMQMVHNTGDAKIVRSTIDLAHSFGLEVVAEGVETLEILERLTEMGCDAAQGYYMSKPVRTEAFTHWLRASPWGLSSPPDDVAADAA